MALELDAKMLMDCSPIQIAILDSRGCIITTNEAWRTFAIENGGDLKGLGVGANYFDACRRAADGGDEDASRVIRGFEGVVDGSDSVFEMLYPCHSSRERRWFTLRFVSYGDGEHFVVTHDNVTEQYLADCEIRKRACTDGLTGALNRRSVLEHLAKSTEFKCPSMGVCVMMLDVDHFKSINDAHGHQVGDDALRAICSRIRSCLRADDVLGRFGGEEFLVVLPDRSIESGVELAERVRRSVSEDPLRIGDTRLNMTITIGVAHTVKNADPQDLIRLADGALYEGKRSGRNRVVARCSDSLSDGIEGAGALPQSQCLPSRHISMVEREMKISRTFHTAT